MTQERKDQLYDKMIGWICEHFSNDAELFSILHEQIGMTKDELHDHCIESLDEFFPSAATPVDHINDAIKSPSDEGVSMRML